ncbi:hypothetical protein [Streptomyces sp. LN785]|uniref:hypothetical protein n=1 Tax=Streptomyces sp. LN785 TaxID=3112983 RepID=UPI00371DAD87
MTETERVDCTDCFALPGPDNTRIAYVKTGGSETWHIPDCPALAITQINMEEENKRVREQDAWALGVFPAARERIRKAAAVMPAGTAAQPFIDALTELVQAQAGHHRHRRPAPLGGDPGAALPAGASRPRPHQRVVAPGHPGTVRVARWSPVGPGHLGCRPAARSGHPGCIDRSRR